MGTSKKSSSSNQSQSGNIAPWEPTQGALQGILSGINSSVPHYQPTQVQSQALSDLVSNSTHIPNYQNAASSVANDLISGGENYSPIINNAFGKYEGAVSPFLSGSLDPTQTPGLSDALATIRNDVSNRVNGMFAGAGRDLSGLNQQALARGITQAEAPVLVGQYNQNVANRLNAANGLLSGAQSTANDLSGLQQTALKNQIAGVTTGGSMVQNAGEVGPLATLSAAQRGFNLPITNLAQLEGLTVPLASLGRQYSGTTQANSETTSKQSPFSMLAGFLGGGSSSPAAGAFNILQAIPFL